MEHLKKLLKHFRNFQKVRIGFFACCVFFQANAMDFETFYQQVHKQTLERNFVRFRNRVLVSVDAYHLLPLKEKEVLNQFYPLVLVFDRIDRFIYFNEQSGVGVSTQRGSHLQFDIAYYETLKDIGMGEKIRAMCVLPYFDKCILLGFEMF
ncbi:hypothetical protein [Helicobacter winghamensis]|mgnify:CR=1 FL=1|nr:hypothetical protein [Helicobacter winghamensis]